MDDELPLFIYLTTQINMRNAIVEISMIEDYLMFSKSIDKESKVLTNLRVNLIIIFRALFFTFPMTGQLVLRI